MASDADQAHQRDSRSEPIRGEGEGRNEALHQSGDALNRPADLQAPPGNWREDDAALPDDVVALSREDAVRLFGPDVARPSRVTPMRVVGAQIALTLCSILVCALLSHQRANAALSALLGGLACWVPSALFALQLRRRGRESVGAWMLAEGIKLGLTIAMFIAIAVLYKQVRWLPLLVTYVLALKTYWLALAWR